MEKHLYKKIQEELLISLRGRHSSLQISMKMGKKFNAVSRWISSSSSMSWNDFVDYSLACGFDQKPLLVKIFGFRDDPMNYSEILRYLIGSRTAEAVSRDLGISKNTVHNWLAGRTCPKFFVMLQILDLYQFILLDYITAMVSLETIPCLANRLHLDQRRRSAIYENPILEAAIAILELPGCQNITKSNVRPMEEFLKITETKARKIIETLIELKIAEWRHDQLQIVDAMIETRGNFPQEKSLRVFWAKQFIQFCDSLERPPQNSLSGYFIAGISKEGEQLLHEEYFRFLLNVRTIFSQHRSPAHSAKILSVNLIDLLDLKNSKPRPDKLPT